MRKRGLALILVVGVLGVLAVLGTAFSVLSRLERRASRQRMLATQAALLARSGMEDAQARIRAGQDPEDPASGYLGEDWDASGTLNGLEIPAEQYGPGRLDLDRCPVSQALRPTFFKRDNLGKPILKPIGDKQRGFSGVLGGQTYALKILGTGFYVNAGNPALISNPTATTNLNVMTRRLFGNLAEALDREDGADDGAPVDETDGWNVVDLRPTTGWVTMEDIRDLALGGNRAKLEALEPYLALRAWVDFKVIKPNARNEMTCKLQNPAFGWDGNIYECWADVKMGHVLDYQSISLLATRIRGRPFLERLPFTKVVGRAPVDLAWARRRRPALIALLGNLRTQYWDGTSYRNAPYSSMLIGKLREARIDLDWSQPSDDCRMVADALQGSTSELRTWEQLHAFCDALPLTGVSDLGQAKRDLLKANFNPNTDANKFNPDPSMARLTDKTDLLSYSTELNLHPRGGGKVSCVARILDKAGRVAAQRTLSVEILQDPMLKLTTQGEFMAGNLGNPARANDESDWRAFGSSPFLTPSQGPGKTWGHSRWGDPGLGLQTAPEQPGHWLLDIGAPAYWDGQLRQATVETSHGAPGMMFLAHWDLGSDAAYSGGLGNLADVQDPDYPTTTPDVSVWDTPDQQCSGQYPDGYYCEKRFGLTMMGLPTMGDPPGFACPGNMAGTRGTVSFWLKPNYDTAKLPPLEQDLGPLIHGRRYWRNYRLDRSGNPWKTAQFDLMNFSSSNPMGSTRSVRGFSFFWECEFGPDGSPVGEAKEQAVLTPQRDVRRRWYLLSAFWDMLPTGGQSGLSARLWVDRGRITVPEEQNTPWSYAQQSGFNLSAPAVDFTAPPIQPTQKAVFGIGREPLAEGPFGSPGDQCMSGANDAGQSLGPDCTFDEFAIYDFGTDSAASITASQGLVLTRYVDGRYYKGTTYGGLNAAPGALRDAGEWFSAPIDLGGVRLRTLSWTQIVPRGLRAPVATLPEDGDDGPNDQDGRIALELAHKDVQVPAPVAGPDYALDASNREIGTLFVNDKGERLDRPVTRPFRLHAVFQPFLADPLNKAILDPLVLDDVTLTYSPLHLPAFSVWREGE